MNMQHDDAVRAGIAERYILGELSAPEALDYEEHFFDCRECAEEVKAAAELADQARQLFQAEVRAPAAGRQPPAPIRPRRRLRLLAVTAAAAAVLAVTTAAYQALVVIPALRSRVAQTDVLQAAPWFFLSVSRAEPQVVTLAPGQQVAALTLSRSSDRSHPYYRCQVLDSAGQVRESATVSGPAQGGELQIVLPTSRLLPGAYRIEVAPLDASLRPIVDGDVVRYAFELRRQEERR